MSYCRITGQYYPVSEMKKVKTDGKYILVHESIRTYTCEECGDLLLPDDTHEAYKDGSTVLICEDCAESYYRQCDDCGQWIYEDEIRYYEDLSETICNDCIAEDYTYCECCEQYTRNDDAVETDTGQYLCSYCAADYARCEDCGRVIYSEDCYYEDDDGEHEYPRCRRCWQGGEQYSSSINCYSYKPTPKFKKIYHEKKTNEYFGFEIEVEGKAKKADEFLKAFGDTDQEDIYLKKDGSVAGFEIVTQPMTRRWFYKKFLPKLENGMKYLRKNGFKGHNRAGIHIHVSSEAISQEQYKKLMLLLYPDNETVYNKWLAITQRHNSAMSQWSSMKLTDMIITQNNKKQAKEETRKRKKNISFNLDYRKSYSIRNQKVRFKDSRYTAINYTGPTVEFRIFNSNIRTERIIKNAQVIFSLLDFTATDKLPTYHNYIRFIEENKENYKELWEFLLEKHIYTPKEEKAKMKKMLNAAREIDASVSDYTTMMNMLRQMEPREVTGIDDNDERQAEGGVDPCVLPF